MDKIIDLDNEGIEKTTKRPEISPLPAQKGDSLKDRLDALLSKANTTKYYSFRLPSGREIEMRTCTFEDERQATIDAEQKNISVLQALEQIVIKDLNVSKLPYFDELFILLKMRQLSHGPILKLHEVVCNHCEAKFTDLQVDLNDLHVNCANPPITDLEKDVYLPGVQVNAKIRIPTIGDENLMRKPISEYLDKLILEIEGETDPYVLKEFIKHLRTGDIAEIKNAALSSEYGVDTEVSYTCKNCGKVNEVNLPLNSAFLPLS